MMNEGWMRELKLKSYIHVYSSTWELSKFPDQPVSMDIDVSYSLNLNFNLQLQPRIFLSINSAAALVKYPCSFHALSVLQFSSAGYPDTVSWDATKVMHCTICTQVGGIPYLASTLLTYQPSVWTYTQRDHYEICKYENVYCVSMCMYGVANWLEGGRMAERLLKSSRSCSGWPSKQIREGEAG